jgi:hypothetical protein|tara:strand:- start:612 stop:830 length:219 start_codon:yes stop_codon:yes gene_type:complete
MEKNWINIFNSSNPIEVEIVKQMLNENNINAVILNKQDSSYNLFGSIDLYVKEENQTIALQLINEQHNERNT